MKRLSILIDADDCIFDFLPIFLDEYSERAKEDIDINDITEWNLSKFLSDDKVKDEILSDSDLFYSLPLKRWAVDVLAELNDVHDIFIATAGTPKAILGKALAINTKLPFIDPTQIFYGWDKSRYHADVIIDDNLLQQKNFRKTNPKCESIIFDMPHNRIAVLPHYRVHDWQDVHKSIVDIEKRRGL